MNDLFLSSLELEQLTGRKFKSRQIEWLRQNGVPFRVNATGHPVVTRAIILGQQQSSSAEKPRWSPRVVGV